MAKRKAKQKSSMLGWAMLAVVLIGAVLLVVGVFLNWTQVNTESVIGNAKGGETTLSEYAEMIQKGKEADDALGDLGSLVGAKPESVIDGKMAGMVAFAYLTMIAGAVTAVLFLLTRVLNIGLLRLLARIGAAATLVCLVVMLICTIVFTSGFGAAMGELVKVTMVPAVGAWLAIIGGAMVGAGALVGASQK